MRTPNPRMLAGTLLLAFAALPGPTPSLATVPAPMSTVTCAPNGPANAFYETSYRWPVGDDEALRWWRSDNNCQGPAEFWFEYRKDGSVGIAVQHGTHVTTWARRFRRAGIKTSHIQGIGTQAGLANACRYDPLPRYLLHRDGKLTRLHCTTAERSAG